MNKVYALVWNQAQGCWSVTDEGARRRRRSGTRKGLVVMVAGLLGLGGLPAAFALPTGHAVVSGNADILTFDDGRQMAINQHTEKLITNWNDFSVKNGQTVTFNQPTKTSIALNRVIGVNGSNIQGQIKANGQVFLINPNGVVFGNNAQVNVGGLVTSTQNISDANFTAGNYKFAGTSSAEILNQGAITASDGGSVALLGAKVRNDGTIKAQKGRVALGGGNEFTVSFDSSNLLDLKVDAAAINALVSNGGLLKADGGQVLMTAKSAGSMLQTVVNNQGAIEANTLSRKAGKITLDGGDVGVVNVGGSLTANALNTVGNGGVIETKGAHTKVQLAARVNTQANNGRVGTWKISSTEVKVGPTATSGNNTVYADTLSHNLANTRVELSSKSGDVSLDGAIAWNSGNQLSINSAKDIHINSGLKGSGAGTRIELNAERDIKLNGAVELSGINSSLGLDYGNAYALGKDGRVTLSGSGAWFDANGALYNVIQNAEQLQGIDTDGLDGLYVLGNDIKGSGNIKSIGGNGEFTGTFDGLGNTISGFTVNTDGPYGGLFASSSGDISNLKLASMTVNGASSSSGFGYVGGLVGLNHGTITNVSATDMRVNAQSKQTNVVGGLVGVNAGGTVDRSSVAGTVVSNERTLAAGGLVGENTNGAGGTGYVTNSSTHVFIAGDMQNSPVGGIGGLVGVNKNGVIADSSSSAVVGNDEKLDKKRLNIGGLVGYNQGGSIQRSISKGGVIGYGSGNYGGLIGFNNFGTVSDSAASGVVFARNGATAGGLVGLNQNSSLNNVKVDSSVWGDADSSVGGLVGKNINSRISTAEVSGNSEVAGGGRVGGLIGYNYGGIVEYSVARATVYGDSGAHVGGLVGYNDGDLRSVEASGSVYGNDNSYVGGLVGTNGNLVNHSIDTASATGNVSGGKQTTVGGLVGQNNSQIINSLASGQVSGGKEARLGGLVGLNSGDVRQSVALGKINIKPDLNQIYGGLVGVNYGNMIQNAALGAASQVPLAGINQGLIRD